MHMCRWEVYDCEHGGVHFVCADVCAHACVYVLEQEKSLGRVMLTVGWPWGSQSSSCRWRGWLSASLPTHDGSFIIIRHTVKRCCSDPQDRELHLCVHVLVFACMFMSLRVRDNRMETEQEALSLITAACLSMCLSACACHRYACLRVSLWTCAYPYLDGRRIACQSTSGRVLHFSACAPRSINKGLCHNPNLTSP